MIKRLLVLLVCAIVGAAHSQSLSPTQQQTLKAAINATPTWAAYPTTGDGPTDLAALLNQPAAPTFTVWRTNCPVSTILDSITWASYTPNDKVASTDTDPTLSRKMGWLLEIQVKQMNLQIMTQGRDSLNMSLPNVRGGLRDAVIQVPSGASGAATAPGGASGATVLSACTRPASEAEKALATASQGSDTTGSTTARVLGWEGRLTAAAVLAARLAP